MRFIVLVALIILSSCSAGKILSGHSISMKHESVPADKELQFQNKIRLKYCSSDFINSDQGYVDMLLLAAHKKSGADFFVNFEIEMEWLPFQEKCFKLIGTSAFIVEKK